MTLLAHAACFAPGEPLPRWRLLDTLELPGSDSDRVLLAEDSLTRLINLGLLETDGAGFLRLHRLLVAFVQAVLVDEAAQASVEATILRVANDVSNIGDPRPLLAVQSHLRFITEAAQAREAARTAGLCHALGFHLRQLGVYPEAQGYLEQALATFTQRLGLQHPDTAASLHQLGLVLHTGAGRRGTALSGAGVDDL